MARRNPIAGTTERDGEPVHGRPMKIAQVAPLFESVPTAGHGGTDRIVWNLAEQLLDLGHEVTHFASGDSRSRACTCSCRRVWG